MLSKTHLLFKLSNNRKCVSDKNRTIVRPVKIIENMECVSNKTHKCAHIATHYCLTANQMSIYSVQIYRCDDNIRGLT